MRLVDADKVKELLERYGCKEEVLALIDSVPTENAVVLPCPIGSDCWWVFSETMEVECEKGGVTGFVIRENGITALDKAGEQFELHSQWGCLTKEEAEAFREAMLKERKV